MLHIRPAGPDDGPYIAACYRDLDFAACGPDDEVVVAEDGGAPRGLGRLVPLGGGAVELGGIFVEPAARRHGVAAAVVRALLERAGGRRVYCVPFARLVDYYKQFGFVDAPVDGGLPAGIVDKLRYCQGRYPDTVAVLVRP
jgi:GNAT superfamily N-acetyltransferase